MRPCDVIVVASSISHLSPVPDRAQQKAGAKRRGGGRRCGPLMFARVHVACLSTPDSLNDLRPAISQDWREADLVEDEQEARGDNVHLAHLPGF